MKITFEFDTSDLPGYAGGENIEDVLRIRLINGVLEAKMIYLTERGAESVEVHKATLAAYDEEEKLVRRMLAGMKIER
jgi:hypothetical protein